MLLGGKKGRSINKIKVLIIKIKYYFDDISNRHIIVNIIILTFYTSFHFVLHDYFS